jgi:hypothetical protein
MFGTNAVTVDVVTHTAAVLAHPQPPPGSAAVGCKVALKEDDTDSTFQSSNELDFYVARSPSPAPPADAPQRSRRKFE